MKLLIQETPYEVKVMRKRGNKNTYIRVKPDLTILVTTNPWTTDRAIQNVLEENYRSIVRMVDKVKQKKENNDGFFFLGKKYDLIYTNQKEVTFGETKVFVPKNFQMETFYRKEAKILFQQHLDQIYERFSRAIPYPHLRVRIMRSRWGVCNVTKQTITLNLELIKRDPVYLDYVIVHELSHLIYPNHQALFWALVAENDPNYKKLRHEMKDF